RTTTRLTRPVRADTLLSGCLVPGACFSWPTLTGAKTSESSARGRRPGMRESNMKKTDKNEMKDELRPEYDLTKLKVAGRGMYAQRYKAGTNLVLLAPDVVEYFPDQDSVNSALRSLINIAKTHRRA